ncbi:MAG: hypothetical protein UHS51_07385, partial [Atopobiaceae bacterium]|nr:hypothetical protein [Atopobiaceae bacterium]
KVWSEFYRKLRAAGVECGEAPCGFDALEEQKTMRVRTATNKSAGLSLEFTLRAPAHAGKGRLTK